LPYESSPPRNGHAVGRRSAMSRHPSSEPVRCQAALDEGYRLSGVTCISFASAYAVG
jgi:hypothetical protein